MFRSTVPPIEPGRGEAPSTATLAGAKKGSSDATTAAWSRSSTRSRNSSVGAIGNDDLDLALGRLARHVEPGAEEDVQHAMVVREDARDEALDAGPPRELGELLEEPGADAAPLEVVRDREADLGAARVTQSGPRPECDEPVAAVLPDRPDERAALAPVRVDERGREPLAHLRQAVEAQVAAALGQTLEQREHGRRVRLRRRVEAESRAVPQEDVADREGCTHASRTLSVRGGRSREPTGPPRTRAHGGAWVRNAQCDIVPFGFPTWRSPTWPRSTCAKACETNG